jgi:predicted nucleic acid-binding protein
MSHLLDVSLLLASAWRSHAQHRAARGWLEAQSTFTTCALAELGFIRVSLTPGFRASLEDAQAALADIVNRPQARFIADDIRASRLPVISNHAEVTDAYLVELARAHRLQLATLDDALCARPWAAGIAVNPLASVR